MQLNSWPMLSVSSRHSLLLAAALARLRAEARGDDLATAEVDVFDLFVGMLLEHPEDGEAKWLLEHFHLTPGQVLPVDYPRPTKDAITRHLRTVSPDDEPPLDSEVAAIVGRGTELGLSSGNTEVVELHALFAAMLEVPSSAITRFIDLLGQRGVSLSDVSRSILRFVEKGAGNQSYKEFLQECHPFSLRPIDIPNYKADHGLEHDLADDMVGIRAEVDAFAYLLASRGLKPPLAVGLFGDWGSGKSFFMESVRKRIEQITYDPQVADKHQSEVPFWKRIVQVEFNAWHYMEGELWASLVDHNFFIQASYLTVAFTLKGLIIGAWR